MSGSADQGPEPHGPAQDLVPDPGASVLRAVLARLRAEALADMAALEQELTAAQGHLQNLQVLYRHHQGHLVVLDARLAELSRAPHPAPPGSDPDPALTAAVVD